MKAWELLSDPTHWTQGAFAKDAKGQDVTFDDPKACCWCTIGALRRCYSSDWLEPMSKLLPHTDGIPLWNDTSDHATVLAKLKELDI